jgi:hypothetical protein
MMKNYNVIMTISISAAVAVGCLAAESGWPLIGLLAISLSTRDERDS